MIKVLCYLVWVTLKSIDLRQTTNKALFLFFGRDPKNQRSLDQSEMSGYVANAPKTRPTFFDSEIRIRSGDWSVPSLAKNLKPQYARFAANLKHWFLYPVQFYPYKSVISVLSVSHFLRGYHAGWHRASIKPCLIVNKLEKTRFPFAKRKSHGADFDYP